MQILLNLEADQILQLTKGAVESKLPIEDYIMHLVNNEQNLMKARLADTVELSLADMDHIVSLLLNLTAKDFIESGIDIRYKNEFTFKTLYTQVSQTIFTNQMPNWDKLSKNSRILIGKEFKDKVENTDVNIDLIKDKTLSNAMLYSFNKNYGEDK